MAAAPEALVIDAEESRTFFARAKEFYAQLGPSHPHRYPMFAMMSAFFAVAAAGIPSPGVMVFGMVPYIAAWSIAHADASLHELNAAVMLELFNQAFFTSPEACLAALSGSAGLVLISNMGRVCRLIDGKAHIYTPKICRGEHYEFVGFDSERYRLHRVVAESFMFMFHAA